MPLHRGKSKATFRSNVREMIHAGHPQKQALAAAYAMQRKSGGRDPHMGDAKLDVIFNPKSGR